MVLDVAVKSLFVVELFALKFAKNLAGGLAKNMGEHVQATPVGHSQNYFCHSEFRGALQHEFQARN